MFGSPQLPRTFEAALRDLESDKPNVRSDAARDLSAHGEEHSDEVLRALTKALGDESPSVRGAAALALADVGAAGAIDALVKQMDDEDVHVKQMVITALGELGDQRAGPAVEKALTAERPEVRFQATMAYSRVAPSHEQAISALLKASRDDDPEVAHIALRMAEELGDPDDHDGAVDARVLERAKAMVRHDTPGVALVAAIIVAREGLDTGHKLLVKAAIGKLETNDQEDVAAAIELCGSLQLEAASDGLERRAFGRLIRLRPDPFAWHARAALAQMGHERARQEILSDLNAFSPHTRTLAVAAAARAGLVEALPTIRAMKEKKGSAAVSAIDEALAALEAKNAS